MKAVILAIILGISATSGLAGAAIAGATPPSDAAGFWAWLIANSPAEEPVNCCNGTDQPCPSFSCPSPSPDPTVTGASRPNRR